MKPIKLTMTAFGPYATEQQIDFGQLGGRNLFVICGNTGAGKTTILDAIAYALYGKASGQDRDGESLRSHFAKDNVLTVVELEFELKGKRYWVRRVPKQIRKRLRGEGYMEQSSEAEFKSLSEQGSEVLCGIKEVNEKLLALLGITYDQFKQIIMIPQGEFRELLVADSKTREEILQKIFGTEGFKAVQQLLEEKAKFLGRGAAELRVKLGEAVAKLDSTDCDQLRVVSESADLNVNAVITETQSSLIFAAEKIAGLEEQIKVQDKLLQEKQQALFQAEQNNRKLAEFLETQEKLAQLQALQPQFEQQKITLQKARKALLVLAAEENNQRCRLEEVQCQTILTTKRAAEGTAIAAFIAAAEEFNCEMKQEEIRKNLLFERSSLENLRGKITQWDENQLLLKKSRQEVAAKDQQIILLKQDLQVGKEKFKEFQLHLETAKKAEQQYTLKEVEFKNGQERFQCLKTLQQERELLAGLRQNYLVLKKKSDNDRESYEKCQQEYDLEQSRFLAGQAALLAKDLAAGKPCPVCGALDHPQPAVFSRHIPSEFKLKELLAECKVLRDNAQHSKVQFDQSAVTGATQRNRVEDMLQRLDHLVTETLSAMGEDQLQQFIAEKILLWQQELEKIQSELQQLAQNKANVDSLTKRIVTAEEQIKEQELQLERLNQEYPLAFGQVQAKESLLLSLAEELPEEIRSRQLLEQKIEVTIKNYEILQQALEKAELARRQAELRQTQAMTETQGAEKALTEAQRALKQAEKNWQAILAAAGFSDEAAYQQAKLTAEAIDSLEKSMNEYFGSLQSARDRHQQLDLETKNLTIEDSKVLQAEQASLLTQKEQFLSAKNDIVFRQKNNQAMLEKICNLAKQLSAAEEEYGLIGHLARIAKGDNGQKVSFERYVLAAFFYDIITAANLRLHKMSAGRYVMRRMEERGKGNGQSGLELEVFDYYTGRARHVKTLSGGESFKASLALALGLADVVQAYSGGISIETMFIDEGFGTLDPESLDSAVQTLIELQHSGRLVGIISHVPELKASVDARLEVEAHKDGSRATLYVC